MRSGRVSLLGALLSLNPDHLEIGQRRTDLLFRQMLPGLQLAQDRDHLSAEPALLRVGTQKQADIGWKGWIWMGHMPSAGAQSCFRRLANVPTLFR